MTAEGEPIKICGKDTTKSIHWYKKYRFRYCHCM